MRMTEFSISKNNLVLFTYSAFFFPGIGFYFLIIEELKVAKII